MNKKIKLSIGIPAYNEEANILKLLVALLGQKQTKFSLKEILIIADGCTDQTASLIRSLNHPLIKLIVKKKRVGQPISQNEIMKRYRGDVIVLFEADMLPYENTTLDELVVPFTIEKNKNLGIVVGQAIASEPQSFYEKIIIAGELLKRDIFFEWKNGKNVYAYGGHAMRAFSRKFAKKLVWPKNVQEDSYAYLKMIELGFSFKKQSKAKAYSRNGAHVGDNLKQSSKFSSGKKTLEKYFSREFIKKEFNPPFLLIAKHVVLGILRSPFVTILCLVNMLFNRLNSFRVSEFSPLYKPYTSTKQIYFNKKLAQSSYEK